MLRRVRLRIARRAAEPSPFARTPRDRTLRALATVLATTLAAPALAAAPAEDPADELAQMEAAEGHALNHGAADLARLVRQLGAGNPWRSRLRGPLGSTLQGFPDIVEVEGFDEAGLGELPFPLASVAGRYDIPMSFNAAVADYIAFFQGPGRKWFAKWLERSNRWVPLFRSILRSHQVPEDLVYLSMIESGFSMHAKSWASAVGPWQFIEPTGKRFGLRTDFWVDERRDPIKSTHAAAQFLKRLYAAWDDWYLAWAGYNAGPGKVSRAIEKYGTSDFWSLAETDDAFRKETRHYVPKLLAAALIAKHPASFGFTGIQPEAPLEWETVEIPAATDLDVIARCAGTPVDEILLLNPELRQWATPPVFKGESPYVLRIPKGRSEVFAEAFAKVKPSERFTFRSYKVQKGDTLGHIARMFSTSVDAMLKANRHLDAKRLRIGQELMIPVPPGARVQTASTDPRSSRR
ncbi:lytic transglycosylase domain-containing protein [Vulgatibacter incomptus]|uniref:Membrane-bound lytic murein transglycosylase D n=1 Tax=Vulgatibacter incomptus TaxID=1391653 RepID=A0A0K1P8Z3_9BACT|nr:lytic transglycosylase domain-containing protein [Vulgatibacter incomptus]AKU89977.1 Membrane-bound lytic murein transglycosylase D precursor [Vulgatibacter incomptus]